MDNALATTPPAEMLPATTGSTAVAAPSDAPSRLADRFKALPKRFQWMAAAGVAGLLALVTAAALSGRDTEMRPLYSQQLTDKETGLVMDKLTQLGVPHQLSAGGTSIMVPAKRWADIRAKLGAANVGVQEPGAGIGYEVLDKSSFGQTQNQERMRIKQVLEGQIVTSLLALDGVKNARVNLALPQVNGFFREQQKPSASVVLTLKPGHTLDRAQVPGIVALVASSVPDLSPKDVKLVDQNAVQLNRIGEDDNGLDNAQLQYRRDIEAQHQKRVLELLEPVLGRENVRATVTADVDFSRVEQMAERHQPNQGPDAKAAVRALQTDESGGTTPLAPTGTPGVASNVPQQQPSTPINGGPQATGAASTPGGASTTRRQSTTQFEVDRTSTHTQFATGSVKRLSAAVVVNFRSKTDADGKVTTEALTDKEIEQLTTLVQQGIGFDAERGDVVKVVNTPFRPDPGPEPEPPLWKQPWVLDALKTAALPLAMLAVGLALIFGLMRPALKEMFPPPPPPADQADAAAAPGSGGAVALVDEVVGEEVLTPEEQAKLDAEQLLLEQTQLDRLEQARVMARQNPTAVANIIRSWLSGEEHEPAPAGSKD